MILITVFIQEYKITSHTNSYPVTVSNLHLTLLQLISVYLTYRDSYIPFAGL
jgi:hypothetical protein